MSTFIHWIPMGGVLEALAASGGPSVFMSRFGASYGVTTSSHATIDLTDNFSFCAWVYATNRSTQYIASKYNLGGNQSWIFSINGSGQLKFDYNTTGSGSDTSLVATSTVVPLNTFTLVHFRMVAGTIFMGIDAEAEESLVAATIYSSSTGISIGWLTFLAYSNSINIMQPMLFNVVSSAANFVTIYNGDSNGDPLKFADIDTGITDDCVMCLELSSDDKTLTDLSVNSNDGSFPTGAWVDGTPITWGSI